LKNSSFCLVTFLFHLPPPQDETKMVDDEMMKLSYNYEDLVLSQLDILSSLSFDEPSSVNIK